MLTDLVIGKPVSEALATCGEFLTLMQSQGRGEPDEEVLEDAVAFAGRGEVPGPGEVRAAGWMALKDATAQA